MDNPLTDAERDEAIATGHADLLIDVGPCGMAYRELVARTEAAESSLAEIIALWQKIETAKAERLKALEANTENYPLGASRNVKKLQADVLELIRAKVEGEGA